uniref:Peptidase S1 domain-containing protein n=1 Tax=Steinernema glaseri TaxID=37863 RepID=A0A1I7ZBT0_9BILA
MYLQYGVIMLMFQCLLLPFVLLTVQSMPLADLLQKHDLLQQHRVPTSDLVFGGSHAKLGDFPSQVFLRITDSSGRTSRCGGSLISPTHVLTAGHCLEGDVYSIEAILGAVNIDSPGAVREYARTYKLHPNFFINDTSINSDIAILELFSSIDLTNANIQLAKFVKDDEELLKSIKAVVSGFGTYKREGNDTVSSDDLLYAEVDLFSFDFCRNALFTRGYGVTILNPLDHMLCAGAKGFGVGPGDSGGPLRVRHNGQLYQVGLVSFGDDEGDIAELHQDESPSFFTRLSSYCDFIENTTNGAAKCGGLNDMDETAIAAVTVNS